MKRPIVFYTDPPWAIGPDGTVDPSRATVERDVLGEEFELRFATARGGRYATSGAGFHREISGAHALVIHRFQVDPSTVDLLDDTLRVVGRQGVGYDNLNRDLLKSRGIIGFNIPDYCVDEVASHTLALILALERRIVTQHNGLAAGTFDVYAGGIPRRLSRCSAGIIGFGRMGRAVSTRLRMFYGAVAACDPYVADDVMAAYGVRKVDLATLLSDSDVVLLHCWLDDATRGMLDAAAFARMRPGALVVNAARGALVDAKALWDALSSGHLGGAGIDVFSPENPHENEWYAKVVGHPSAVVTSHRAYLSSASEHSQRRRTAEGIRHVLSTGRPPTAGHQTEGVSFRFAHLHEESSPGAYVRR
jgi:phosphoglycerate dehydrogenase-like enzyme